MTTRDIDQILHALSEIGERIAVLETKLDSSADHDDRMRKLEQRWAMLSGIVAFVAIELQMLGLVLAYANGGRG